VTMLAEMPSLLSAKVQSVAVTLVPEMPSLFPLNVQRVATTGPPVETPSLFSQVIQDHLELKERNSRLEQEKPLENYKAEDPFENHPLFKTEEQARLEETMDGEEPAIVVEDEAKMPDTWPTEENVPQEEGLWTKSRDFDWGD